MHKLDKTEYEAKKAARAELKKPHGNINSVAALRDQVYLLETVVGIKGK